MKKPPENRPNCNGFTVDKQQPSKVLPERPPVYSEDAFLDAFLPDDEPELLPDEGDFWIEPD